MSLFRRPRSPFWYTEIQVGGRRVVRSTGTDDKREARAYERRLRAQLEAEAGKPQRRELTLDQACGRYWLEKGHTLADADGERRHLRRIAGSVPVSFELSDVSNETVASLVRLLESDGAGPAGVNRCLACFRQVLRRAARLWGQQVQQIHWQDHFRREPKGRTRWLTKDEAIRLLDACPEPLRLSVEWSLLTGTRRAETFRIEWSDVDFDRGQVKIRKGKTGSRIIWLTDDSRALLLRCPRRNSTDLVFDKTNLRKLWAAALAASGVDDFTFHDLRHTHATWLRQGGAPLEIVQRSLGHASITTTQRYAHVDDREVRGALSQLPTLSPSPDHGQNVIPLKRRKKSK